MDALARSAIVSVPDRVASAEVMAELEVVVPVERGRDDALTSMPADSRIRRRSERRQRCVHATYRRQLCTIRVII